MDSFWIAALWSILPTIVVVAIAWALLRGIIRADRVERRAYLEVEAEERAKRGLPPRAS